MKLLNGDCLEKMKELSDNSVDIVICDLPYGRFKHYVGANLASMQNKHSSIYVWRHEIWC